MGVCRGGVGGDVGGEGVVGMHSGTVHMYKQVYHPLLHTYYAERLSAVRTAQIIQA